MPTLCAVTLLLALTRGVHGFGPGIGTTSRFATNLGNGYLDGLQNRKTFSRPKFEIRTIGGTFINETNRLKESTFDIPPEELIELAKDAIRAGLGTKDETVLADDFQFSDPFVGPLNKEEYLGAFNSFDLLHAFPDLDNRYYNFHVDPFEYNRVWYTTRPLATHTGKLFGKEPSGKEVELPPQTQSLKFDETGRVTDMTIGYVIDKRVGNTGGLGGAFGFFYGVGQPLPFPECKPYKKSRRFRLFSLIGKIGRRLRGE